MIASYSLPRKKSVKVTIRSVKVSSGRISCSTRPNSMIKKWKVTPVSTRQYMNIDSPEDGRRSRDDSEASQKPLPRKPRRHTTGGTKQTVEDIRRAKELNMTGETIVNEIGQEIDPNSTLGRKQLIAMLKQRYGPEIETFRNSGDINGKEKVRRDRQRERDRRHQQRMLEQESTQIHQQNGVHHSPALNSSRTNSYRPVLNSHGGSDDSEDTSLESPPQVKRTAHMNNTEYEGRRMMDSDDEQYKSTLRKSKDVIFLQYRDEVKRINLPSSVSSLDTLKALFVNAYPGKIAMPHFEEGFKSLYIKDMETGVYYQLEDISEVVNRSFLKIQEIDNHSDSYSEYAFRTQTLPNHHGRHGDYAESLQDFQLSSSRNRRRDSETSQRSENILTKATYKNERSDPYSYIENSHTTIQPANERPATLPVKKKAASEQAITVQDQLEDLSELLRTALNEEDKYHSSVLNEAVDIKNPGKINQSLIDNLQNKTESSARQKVLPKHYQATAFVMAQQESDKKTSQDNLSSQKVRSSATVKLKVNSHRTNEITDVNKSILTTTDVQDGAKPNSHAEPNNTRVEEGYVSPANRQKYQEQQVELNPVSKTVQRETLHLPLKAHTSPVKSNQIKDSPKTESEDDTFSTQLADELLSQLMDLEEEVKAQSSSLNSSRSVSRHNSTTSSCSRSGVSSPKKPVQSTNETEHRARGLSVPVSYNPDQSHSPQGSKPRTMTLDQLPVYATVNKTNSPKTTTFHASTDSSDGEVFVSTPTKSSPTRQKTREMCEKPSVTTPDFVELEDTARDVKMQVRKLKKDLSDLRKNHVENTRNFKADIQKKLLEFRKKAGRVDEYLQQRLDVNNNFIFANEHPVRERRHRITGDQMEYETKMADTKIRLQSLEGNMEMLRIDVVNKKRVENPAELDKMHEELTKLTKRIAEIKNRYHGLHDMLKVIISSEMEVIEKEKMFLKQEPEKLEELISRCKMLSGTLFTLQKLASVQSVSPVNSKQPQLSF